MERLDLKPCNDLWVCIARNGNVDFSTLSYKRSDSIKKCIDGLNPNFNWKWFKSKGWQCAKVNVSFDPHKFIQKIPSK